MTPWCDTLSLIAQHCSHIAEIALVVVSLGVNVQQSQHQGVQIDVVESSLMPVSFLEGRTRGNEEWTHGGCQVVVAVLTAVMTLQVSLILVGV